MGGSPIRVRSRLTATPLLVTVVLLGCGSNAGPAPAPPAYVPLQYASLVPASAGLLVEVQIGNAPSIPALVDTGSAGLRIQAGSVGCDAFESVTDTPVVYGYGTYDSSVAITGVLAYADLQIGTAKSGHPIAVMIVNDAGCTETGTNCRSLDQTFSLWTAVPG
jgi:hypothetical protein